MNPKAPNVELEVSTPPDIINKEIYYMDIPTNTPIYKADHSFFGYTTTWSSRPTYREKGTRFITTGEQAISLEAIIKYKIIGERGEGYVIDSNYIEH
jgi:hypothetical protein